MRILVSRNANEDQPDTYRAVPAGIPEPAFIGLGRSKAEAIGSLVLKTEGKDCWWPGYGWPVFQIEDASEL